MERIQTLDKAHHISGRVRNRVMQHCVWRCLFTTGTVKFIEIEGKIDGCRKTCRKQCCSPKSTRTWKTIHLPADQPHRAEVTVEWLKSKKALQTIVTQSNPTAQSISMTSEKSFTNIPHPTCQKQFCQEHFFNITACDTDSQYSKRHIDASKGRVQPG